MKHLTPVIHVKNLDQALKNADICVKAGVHGFFLINHGISYKKLAKIAVDVREWFPKAWIGVNILDADPLTAIPELAVVPNLNAWWVDDPKLIEGQVTQDLADQIRQSLHNQIPSARYFGSVAFKYQPQPVHLANMTRLASQHMDVITTSGEATGHAANAEKIACMFGAAGSHPLALASGVTCENAAHYLPYITWFLVATGISLDFHNLDPVKVAKLQQIISANK